jgi:hypothetical protein
MWCFVHFRIPALLLWSYAPAGVVSIHITRGDMATAFKPTTADTVEAIGMRILRIAEDMTSQSRHQGRSERLIEDVEQAAQDLRAAVRGR